MSTDRDPDTPYMLLIRPNPMDDESRTGYADRIARKNGYDGIGALLRISGWDGAYPRVPAPHAGWLGPVGRELLGGLFPTPMSRNMLVWLDRERMPKRFLTHMRQRLCPLCLRDGCHRPAQWDLVWASACGRHAVRLIDTCPSCADHFPWYRTKAHHCVCGFDLRECSTSVPGPEELLSNDLLAKRVKGGASQTVRGRADDRLAATSGADLCVLFRFIAVHVLRLLPVTASAQRLQCKDAAPLMEAIGGALASWPQVLCTHLMPGNGVEQSRGEIFGHAWKCAKDLPPSNARSFLLSGFEEAYASLAPHAAELRRGRYRAERLDHLKWLTLEQAAKVSGSSRERLRRLIHQEKLPACRVSYGKVHAWRIRRDDLARWDRTRTPKAGCEVAQAMTSSMRPYWEASDA